MSDKLILGIFDSHPAVIRVITNEFENYENSLKVIFAVATKEELKLQMTEDLPHLLIIDVVSREVAGLELLGAFQKACPEVKIIAYSGLSSPALVESLLFSASEDLCTKDSR